jgi:hypothetical protein
VAPKRRERAQTRTGPAGTLGWSVAVALEALLPLAIGLVILVFVIVAFVESSPNYP